MNKIKVMLAAFAVTSLAAVGLHAGTASAVLSSFIQTGTITNTSGAGVNMTEVYYTLGPAGDNVATWDGGTGGGTAEDQLSNPNFFQTVRWTGLNVAPGEAFNFSGLDIDLIVTLDPLNVTGSTLDTTGDSLRGGYVRVEFSDGSSACAPLVQQAWATQQNLTLTEGNVDAGSCGNDGGTIRPPVVETQPVPTLGQYGIMLMILLMAAVGYRSFSRR